MEFSFRDKTLDMSSQQAPLDCDSMTHPSLFYLYFFLESSFLNFCKNLQVLLCCCASSPNGVFELLQRPSQLALDLRGASHNKRTRVAVAQTPKNVFALLRRARRLLGLSQSGGRGHAHLRALNRGNGMRPSQRNLLPTHSLC